MKKAVFIGNAGDIARVYSDDVLKKLHEKLDFPTDRVITKAEFAEYRDTLREVDCIFSTWGMPHLSREEIREFLPEVKAVFYAAGSVRHFAREFLDEGAAVFSAWAANAVPVAEFTFAQIILAAKGFFGKLHRVEEGSGWAGRRSNTAFTGNYDTKIGIIGAGMIGKLVIERLKTLEKTEILVYDPFLPDEKAAELGVKKTSLDEIFAECDVISNHLANNPQTVGILGGRLFEQMKPSAVFINTGRGAQVVESEMIAALREVPTRAAVLDVTDPEPPRADSPLYTMPNVYLTPHIAGSIGNEVHRMAEYMYEEFEAFEENRPTRYSVTAEMLKTMA